MEPGQWEFRFFSTEDQFDPDHVTWQFGRGLGVGILWIVRCCQGVTDIVNHPLSLMIWRWGYDWRPKCIKTLSIFLAILGKSWE